MRLAVLTFHRAHNCGAMLQAWALSVALKRMGHWVEFPECNHIGEASRYLRFHGNVTILKTLRSFFYRLFKNVSMWLSYDDFVLNYASFRQTFLNERLCCVNDFKTYYDGVIIGSDQVWNKFHCGRYYELFTGKMIPQEIPRIGYAASYGDRCLTDDERDQLIPCLRRFCAVSVRERAAQNELTRLGVKDVAWVVDPTLLLTAEDYRQATSDIRARGPYLYVYWVSGGKLLLNTARSLAKRLKVKLIVTPVYIHSKVGAPKGVTLGVSPGRLLAYTQQATYVLAASFHGTVFGLLFKKPFLSFRERPDVVESRPASLLNSLGIPERLVTPAVPIEEMVRLLHDPIPEEVYSVRLPKLRQESLNWLKAALDKVARGLKCAVRT